MDAGAGVLIPLLHQKLYQHYGPLNWWPAESPFEVIVGAILTQNTAWNNVAYALNNLKKAGTISPERMADIPLQRLEELIKPSGFFRQKAQRLKLFSQHLIHSWQSSIDNLCGGELNEARSRLIALKGIGPETADSILLYAAHRPSFVVDAYTRRIFERIGLLCGNESYDEIRNFFMKHLPRDVSLYNEYHAQIVNLAKDFCKKRTPVCAGCPLIDFCNHARLKTGKQDMKVCIDE